QESRSFGPQVPLRAYAPCLSSSRGWPDWLNPFAQKPEAGRWVKSWLPRRRARHRGRPRRAALQLRLKPRLANLLLAFVAREQQFLLDPQNRPRFAGRPFLRQNLPGPGAHQRAAT